MLAPSDYGSIPLSSPRGRSWVRDLEPLLELSAGIGITAVAVKCSFLWFAAERRRDDDGYVRTEMAAAVLFVFLGPLGLGFMLRGSLDLVVSSVSRRLVSWVLCVLVSGALFSLVLSAQIATYDGFVGTTGMVYVGVSAGLAALWLPVLFRLAVDAAAASTGATVPAAAARTAAARRDRERAGVVAACAILVVAFVAALVSPSASDGFTLGATTTARRRPDVVAFYAFMAAVAALGGAAQRWPSTLGRSLRAPFAGGSRGEALFWTGLCGLLASLVAYWWLDAWDGSVWFTTSRVLGRLSNVLLGLLLLPVSRNSALGACLGVSYEHLIFFHVVLGNAALATMFGHFVLSTSWAFARASTVVVGVVSLIAVPALVYTARPSFRRRKWDIFKRVHCLSLPLVIAVLWHSRTAWFYASGGLVLYAVDLGLRYAKAARTPVRVVEACVLDDAGLVVLAYELDDRDDELKDVATLFIVPKHLKQVSPYGAFDAGQYAWIRVGGLFDTWHPVAYSSSPLDPTARHHVKIQGPGEWSCRLADAVAERGASGIRLAVDGPYGLPPVLPTRLLLIAGGAGIAPLASLLRTLLLSPTSPCERVRLVWTAKRRALFDAFDDDLDLNELSRADTAHRFSAILFETAPLLSVARLATEDGSKGPLVAHTGRPSVADHVLAFVQREPHSDALVLASGPASLVRAAKDAAHASGADFHAISFKL